MKHLRSYIWIVATFCLILAGCSTTRHVPDGQYLLDEVKLRVNDSTETLSEQEMMTFVRQRPNNRMLHLTRLRLGVYNMSGNDSTKWWNKWIRKLGEAPVIFDREAMETDSLQLLRAMQNAGFMESKVSIDSMPDKKHKKIRLRYLLEANRPHVIDTIIYQFPNDTLRRLVMRDSARFIVKPGSRLDRSELETQREWITTRLRNRGYWAFTKEFITFNADTTEGSKNVELTMTVHPPYPQESSKFQIDTHAEYVVRNITVVTDYDGIKDADLRDLADQDTVRYKDLEILYGEKQYLRPSVLYENCFIRQGQKFRQRDVDNTYSALGRLSILKFVQVRMVPLEKSVTWALWTPTYS